MKKIIKKLRKLNNSGSSIVMVIAALAFLAIVVGSLLTAAGYAYKMKFQDLNARDNFYYVEQAMNEVYAGIGADTMEAIKEAYIYTVENMTEYDVTKKMYVTKSDDVCQKMFEDTFISLFYGAPTSHYNDSVSARDRISKFITNSTVSFSAADMNLETVSEGGKVKAVIFKNVKLTRTQDYKKSVANGSFTQTISTDIVVGRPDFKVLFNNANTDYSNLFDYALIADMGIEVNQPSTPLTINGNVYAANDYYNKLYNQNMYDSTAATRQETLSGVDSKYDTYKHVAVTSKTNVTGNSQYKNYTDTLLNKPFAETVFNGENQRSMYSGIYVSRSDVSIIANNVIVPGTIAVMDKGKISIYGREGKLTKNAEVWTDNVVLGGFSSKTYSSTDVNKEHPKYKGSSAVIKADLYVRDDTELNAAGCEFQVAGGYYGYGDSTTKDTRKFISTVDEDNFMIEETSGSTTTKTNRGHYNSSAIIINGEQSKIDFTYLDKLFIAGRTYVEMSKDVKTGDTVASIVDKDGNKVQFADDNGNMVDEQAGITQTFTYNPKEVIKGENGADDKTVFIRDYKMGESMSIKSNYKAYVPIMYTGMPEKAKTDDAVFGEYYEAELHVALQGSDLFEKYFPVGVYDNKIPCVMQQVSGKKYFYYHFSKVYNDISNAPASKLSNATRTMLNNISSPEELAASFISDYVDELNNQYSTIKDYLVDISKYEDFESGNIELPEIGGDVYSSGAITTKKGTVFDITLDKNTAKTDVLGSLFSGNSYVTSTSSTSQIARDLDKEYEYVKWNLGHYNAITADEKTYVDALVSNGNFGDAAITPINRYMNFSKIASASIDYKPSSISSNSSTSADFTDDTLVWISYNDVLVKDEDGKNDGSVTGIVVTKGDVMFDTSVKHFSGIIISGGKIYVNNGVLTIQASPQTCISLLRNCQLSNSEEAKFILELFKVTDAAGATGSTGSDSARTIDTIDYSDVVSFSNWMKNVE